MFSVQITLFKEPFGMKNSNLLELMPTSQNENIATACLAYLLGKEGDSYERLRKKLGIKGAITDIEYIDTEFSFDSRRRIDLLIETRESLYGIEVKLGAFFSDNQLEHYDTKLIKLAKDKGIPYRLIALVPYWQKSKTKEIEIDNLKVVTWEELIDEFDVNDDISKNLKEFITPRLEKLLVLNKSISSNKLSKNQKLFLSRFVLHYFSESDLGLSRLSSGAKFSHEDYYGGYVEKIRRSVDGNKIGTVRIGYLSIQKLLGKVEMVVLTHENIIPQTKSYIGFENITSLRNSSWKTYEVGELNSPDYQAYKVIGLDWEKIGEYLYELFKGYNFCEE